MTETEMPPLIVGRAEGVPRRQLWPVVQRGHGPEGHVLHLDRGPAGIAERSGWDLDVVGDDLARDSWSRIMQVRDGGADERNSPYADWVDVWSSAPWIAWRMHIEFAVPEGAVGRAPLKDIESVDLHEIVERGGVDAWRVLAMLVRGLDPGDEVAQRLQEILIGTSRLDALAVIRWSLRFWSETWVRDLTLQRLNSRRTEVRGLVQRHGLELAGVANTEWGWHFVSSVEVMDAKANSLLDAVEGLVGVPCRLVMPSDDDDQATGARDHMETL